MLCPKVWVEDLSGVSKTYSLKLKMYKVVSLFDCLPQLNAAVRSVYGR